MEQIELQQQRQGSYRPWIGAGIAVGIAVVLATIGIGATDSLQSNLAGQFLDDTQDTRCPRGMVFVNAADGFCVDRYEAAAGDDCIHRDPASGQDSQVNVDMQGCAAVSEPGRTPWRFISHSQAAAACAKAGKHLATNKEWYAAALGTSEAACNTASDGVAASDGDAACVSSSGAHDMVGNAWEWVDAVVQDGRLNGQALPDEGYVTSVDAAGVPLATGQKGEAGMFGGDRFWLNEQGAQGVVRGGSFTNKGEAGVYSFYAASPPTLTGDAVGFRCAQ